MNLLYYRIQLIYLKGNYLEIKDLYDMYCAVEHDNTIYSFQTMAVINEMTHNMGPLYVY